MGTGEPEAADIFCDALELASAAERAAYLERACGGDAGLRRRVERLLGLYGRLQLVRLRGEAVYKPVLFTMGMLAALVLLYIAGLIVLTGRLSAASTSFSNGSAAPRKSMAPSAMLS